MKVIWFFLVGFILLAAPVFAGEGWEASFKVSVQNAENKLFFGQKSDATDGIDGKYDVPALLGGDIKAYFLLEDNKYWRDIKAKGARSWTVIVESNLKDKVIKLGWKPEDLPDGTLLMDDTAMEAFNMKTGNGYSYKNDGPRQFRIVIGQ